MTTFAPAPATSTSLTPTRSLSGWRELGLVTLLYLAYASSRVFASDSAAPARERAMRIVTLEDLMLMDVERGVVSWFVSHDSVGLLAAYFYAVAHYLVTAVVLVWLFRRRGAIYARARQTLIISTVIALVAYILMPTAPPRLVGFADLMARHSDQGWWGEAASAPQGLGWMTNQLAAFPSMHAGWSLWVALAIGAATTSRGLRTAGWAHALVTAIVVVGTGNHWVVDVLAGWAVVILVWHTASVGSQPSESVAHQGAVSGGPHGR